MNRIAMATLVIGIAGLVLAAVAPARAAGSARQVPDGTLTYKIVITGHGAQRNASGSDATVTKSETTIRQELDVTTRLSGKIGSGEIDASGRTNKKVAAAKAGRQSITKRLEACGGDQSCLTRVAMSMSAQDKAKLVHSGRQELSVVGALNQWAQASFTGDNPCHAKFTIRGTENVAGNFLEGGRAYRQRYATRGDGSFDCTLHYGQVGNDSGNRLASGEALIVADPQSGYYTISFPAFALSATRTITNSVGGATIKQTVQVPIPEIDLKGLKLPADGKQIGGERRIEGLRTISSQGRVIKTGGADVSQYTVSVDANRPSIPLDAVVTWTFTPDK